VSATGAQTQSIPAKPVFAVIGADISGSYKEMTSKAMAICKNFVMNANPGDEYVIRTISAESYPPITEWRKKDNTRVRHDNTIEHVKFIDVPSVTNRFNQGAVKKNTLALQKFQTQKRRLAQTLEQMTFEPAPRTDIYGFVAAASDLFANASDRTRKVLLFASDLKDTVGLKCDPNLSHVEVIIEFLVDADPIQSQKRRDAWIQQLKNWGAAQVTVRLAH